MVQTRSTGKRLESGRQVDNNNGGLPQESDNTPPRDDSPPPTKKRRRKGSGKLQKKSRRGKPGDICQLNLDVLFLIFSLLYPMDVLNFARTCKSFRSTLMSKSSVFIWKAARRQVNGLPDCPADLSEPAYANLAFYPRCHACGKYTPVIFWYIRRRYCPECRVGRFCCLESFPRAIWNTIYPIGESITINKKLCTRFDKDQIDSWVQEYQQSSDKEQFLANKRKYYNDIFKHARKCAEWQSMMAESRRDELRERRQERGESILERLKQLGYEREISYFGPDSFREPRKKTSKPLTDREWDRMLPGWLETMNHHRQLRLAAVVYLPRRSTLGSDYKRYVTHRSPDKPSFDLLPHVIDLACFPPFEAIIESPEGTQLGDDPFAPAFAQLPVLVDKWRKQLDVELTMLVKIPSDLVLRDTSRDTDGASNSTDLVEVYQADLNKLRLASALFYAGSSHGVFTYSEIFSASMRFYSYPTEDKDASRRTGSIQDRFNILFLHEAPYIVHACGLDPNVATMDDMDSRNARLKCLCCKKPYPVVVNWRTAMIHACWSHQGRWLTPLSESPRWQLVNDEYIHLIEAAESVDRKPSNSHLNRCILCLPHVGDGLYRGDMEGHFKHCHEVDAADIKEGVHFTSLGIGEEVEVEMVEEDGQVKFRKR